MAAQQSVRQGQALLAVELRAEVGGHSGLRPGEMVSARIQADSAGTSWQLPATALVNGDQGPQAYVRTRYGVRAVRLEIVGQGAAGPLVKGDLQAADHVSTRGVAALRAAGLAAAQSR